MGTNKRGRSSVYRPKEPPNSTVTLSRLAKRILEAAEARTGASRSDVVEHLVRLHGGELTPEEFAPVEQAAA